MHEYARDDYSSGEIVSAVVLTCFCEYFDEMGFLCIVSWVSEKHWLALFRGEVL